MIALYIILGFLLFILILLLIPVKVDIKYNNNVSLKIQYLFFKKHFSKEQIEKEEKEIEKTAEKDIKKDNITGKIKSIIKNCGVKNFVDIIAKLLKILASSSYHIIKKIKVKNLDIYFCAGGQDAAETVLIYGKACAVIYPFMPLLADVCQCKDYSVSVDCDYTKTETTAVAQTLLYIKPIYVIPHAIKLFIKALPFLKKLNENIKEKT